MKEIEKASPKEIFLKQFEDAFKENFLPADWSQEKKNNVTAKTSPGKIKSLMFTSIPMVCQAADCMFASTCPLQQEDNAPEGFPCPYELSMVKDFMGDYMAQLDIDAENLVELSMVRDLVDQEVQYFRKSRILSREDFIQENVVGINNEGDPVMRKELHLAVELEDKLHKRKQILFKQLLATREAKAKVGMGSLDTAQTMSNLVSAFKDVEAEREKLLKQRLGLVDFDDYIDVPVLPETKEDR